MLEFYAQPTELQLKLTDNATGEIHRIQHFPDFLVMRDEGITLEEWKSEAKLVRLAEKYPWRYVRGSGGHWFSPQIEQQLAEIGLGYRIYSEESLSRRRVENLLHLADYFHPGTEQCDPNELRRLHAALQEHGDCTFHVLCTSPFGFQADFLNKAIADHLVVVDLDGESLGDKRRFRLFRDSTLRDFLAGQVKVGQMPGMARFCLDVAAGLQFQYESQQLTVELVGETELVCKVQDSGNVTLSRDWLIEAYEHNRIQVLSPQNGGKLDLSRFKQAQLNEALQRQAILNGESKSATVSERTLQRWAKRQDIATANGANEVLALVPRVSARGNRTPRLTEAQLALMNEVINGQWRNHRAINGKACYRYLKAACKEAGIDTPSYPTLLGHIKSTETSEDVRIRQGKRMSYQGGEFVAVLNVDTPVHGQRPFQYVHIDHTQLDIELISSTTGKPMGRPWLTLAVDAWSRRIVGLYLTYDPASYHSVPMVVRDMVRRHGRLPEFVVVDNGRDFHSEAFESFLQVMNVHLRFRPSGQPRAGAVLERMFGRVNTEYVHNLAGNTKVTKNVRMTTGKHLPVNFAEWTLEAMYYGLLYWAFEFYEQEIHPALARSPREAFQRGLAENGHRPQRQLLLNQDFLIATCPPVDRKGTRQVHPQTGVKVNNLLYWNPQFRDSHVANKAFPVRYDPWDAASVYVLVKDGWLQATCRNLAGLGQLTDEERKILTAEYAHRCKTKLDTPQAEQRLREFLDVFTPEGAMAKAFELQKENLALYGSLQMGGINPVAVHQRHRLTRNTSLSASVPTETRKSVLPGSTDSRPPDNASTPEDLPDYDLF